MRLGRRFYIALVLIVLLMGIGYVFAPFFAIGQWALFVLAVSALVDGVMLYRIRGIRAFRQCATRFSNGDENTRTYVWRAVIRIRWLWKWWMRFLLHSSCGILISG